jgi:predicted TIM-barrel fold metal-dependent hydrolase
MSIDFHTHIFPPDVIAQRESYLQRDAWFGQLYANPKAKLASAEDLVAAMDRSGVDKAVTFGFAWADAGLCHAANQYVLDAVSRWPERLVGFALVNPVAPGARDELEWALQAGLRGLGELMPDGQGYTLDDPRLEALVDEMTEWKRPTLIHAGEPVGHAYAGKSRSTLQPLYHLASRHPQAKLVAAHWGGGLWSYELMPEVRKVLENVYYDTAASLYLYRDEIFPLAARIVADKVLFGTDYPLLEPRHLIERMQRSGLTDSQLRAMLSGNATRLLGA